jgi:hypothetical protein
LNNLVLNDQKIYIARDWHSRYMSLELSENTTLLLPEEQSFMNKLCKSNIAWTILFIYEHETEQLFYFEEYE